jgi:hypothetical protein
LRKGGNGHGRVSSAAREGDESASAGSDSPCTRNASPCTNSDQSPAAAACTGASFAAAACAGDSPAGTDFGASAGNSTAVSEYPTAAECSAAKPNMPYPRMQQMPMRQRQNSGQNRRPDPPANQPLGGALDFLTKDPERAIILILLLILMEERADNSLLFAMMYLLA